MLEGFGDCCLRSRQVTLAATGAAIRSATGVPTPVGPSIVVTRTSFPGCIEAMGESQDLPVLFFAPSEPGLADREGIHPTADALDLLCGKIHQAARVIVGSAACSRPMLRTPVLPD